MSRRGLISPTAGEEDPGPITLVDPKLNSLQSVGHEAKPSHIISLKPKPNLYHGLPTATPHPTGPIGLLRHAHSLPNQDGPSHGRPNPHHGDNHLTMEQAQVNPLVSHSQMNLHPKPILVNLIRPRSTKLMALIHFSPHKLEKPCML
ncbi:hypothetical protein HanHA300_Chr12g0431141 [Helianthus annuus]|nr:hypothetical protein HanHA300_Chr12g0431141 [Helianthus annuus]KAJ0504114.1 hypothetical protein HanHA89_Chr12g0455741 [Helianthus annuus]